MSASEKPLGSELYFSPSVLFHNHCVEDLRRTLPIDWEIASGRRPKPLQHAQSDTDRATHPSVTGEDNAGATSAEHLAKPS
jgi:hypothetical protein